MSTCYCENCIGPEKTEQLHEAAADLLIALETFVRNWDDGVLTDPVDARKGWEAIRKAKGESLESLEVSDSWETYQHIKNRK